MALSELRTDAPIQELCDHFGDWFEGGVKNCAGNGARMTKELYPYTSIFSPIRVNRMTIKNRVVMAPMGNLMMCEEYGRPSEKMIRYFVARAKGGVGLITSGLIPICDKVDPTVTEIGGKVMMPRISPARTLMSGWRDLAQQCHGYGSRFFIQLTPGLGRVGPPTCLVQQTKFPVSASFNRNFYIPELPCLRLSDRKLTRIIKNAGQAAADAKACLIDGVYLHGHEGYLLEQMTNRAFNRRKLGKYADWQRFGLDMVKEIRRRVGPNYPIMYRIDLSLALNETYGDRMDQVASLKKFKNGRSVAETLDYMENLVKAGVDLFDVDIGCYDNWWLPHPPAGMPAGCFLPVSRIVKEHFAKKGIRSNAGVEVPVVAVGKLGYPDVCEQALRGGDCDMVMLGRPLLADPEWCNKAYEGRVEDICPCIGCQEGCVNEFVEGGHIQCAVNARTGFEDSLPERGPAPEKKKKIAVVGGGPAGIVFAVQAAKRGHTVELLEKSDKLGGRVVPGSVPAVKFDFKNYLDWLNEQVRQAQQLPNFTLRLSTPVTTQWLAEQKFDTIVFAVGTKNACPPIPGLDKVKAVQAVDLLVNPGLLGDAKKVVVAGGGVVGCETAYWLRYEQGREVKVVEMLPNFMEGVCTANRGHLLHYMEKAGVELYNCAKVTSFEPGKVHISRNVSKGAPNPYNTWQPLLPENIPNPLAPKLGPETQEMALDADLVVLAMGGRPDDTAYFEALAANAAPEIYNIGDSFAGGRVLEANRAAFRLAARV
ncbi:pyridine nucleotide-disulfide oxidoreductase [Pseudoflavonifractor capillosus ATCC 29799]|uniref:Pyridine nucleotide-disulfide oxidoreductase n=1 Tax=Pseudoflavonifractor capillosus ATCC 29799 TaxID=411467 RepID=A6P2L4_9FIRM|nr:pyridine nucleotide-disulfide oxidoreductase [Pseudoflavonifractor capillosus ATCC 29799]